MEVIVQIVYFKTADRGEDSWMWVKTNAFTSNIPMAEPRGVMLGAIVCGVLSPAFGTHMATQLEGWVISSADEWQMEGLWGAPDANILRY